MKLKDFKNNPEQYNEIVKSLKEKNIPFDDETDMSDLLTGSSAFNSAVNNIVAGANTKRMSKSKRSKELDSVADMIAAGANTRRRG